MKTIAYTVLLLLLLFFFIRYFHPKPPDEPEITAITVVEIVKDTLDLTSSETAHKDGVVSTTIPFAGEHYSGIANIKYSFEEDKFDLGLEIDVEKIIITETITIRQPVPPKPFAFVAGVNAIRYGEEVRFGLKGGVRIYNKIDIMVGIHEGLYFGLTLNYRF